MNWRLWGAFKAERLVNSTVRSWDTDQLQLVPFALLDSGEFYFNSESEEEETDYYTRESINAMYL